jgi:hypothetical protein
MEVDAAVVRLRREGALSAEEADLFGRVARRELVSVHRELRLLLHGGILVAMTGVGLLVKQNFERIGPLHGGFVEMLGSFGTQRLRDSPLRPVAIAGTAVVPLCAIAFGILSRRRLFLDWGLTRGVASLATLRFYVHVAPLWVVLTLGGAAAIAVALAARRFLASDPGGRAGRLHRRAAVRGPLAAGSAGDGGGRGHRPRRAAGGGRRPDAGPGRRALRQRRRDGGVLDSCGRSVRRAQRSVSSVVSRRIHSDARH